MAEKQIETGKGKKTAFKKMLRIRTSKSKQGTQPKRSQPRASKQSTKPINPLAPNRMSNSIRCLQSIFCTESNIHIAPFAHAALLACSELLLTPTPSPLAPPSLLCPRPPAGTTAGNQHNTARTQPHTTRASTRTSTAARLARAR